MDELEMRRLARREFKGEERKAARLMAEVLADVPPTQLTPLSARELVARTKQKMARHTGPQAPHVGGGSN